MESNFGGVWGRGVCNCLNEIEKLENILIRGEILITKKNPLAPMGVLAPGSAHARPSARPPIDTSGNFSADMSGGLKLSESFSDQLSRQIREL